VAGSFGEGSLAGKFFQLRMDANGREKETQITRMNTDLERLKRNMDGQDEQDCFCEM